MKRVTGTVVVEPWNDDFNCSKLEDLQRSGIINELNCNGTADGTPSADTDSSSTESPADPSAETKPALGGGAWAGIGVSLGLVLAGIVGALIWFLIRKRRRARAQAQAQAQQDVPLYAPEAPNDGAWGSAQLDGNQIRELGGWSRTRELHGDGQVTEIGGKSLINEKGNDAERQPGGFSPPTYQGPPVELDAPTRGPTNTQF